MCPLSSDQYGVLMKTMAENRVMQEAMNAARRKRERDVELCLVPASTDKPVGDDVFQTELGTFSAEFIKTGIKENQRAIAFDAVDALGYPVPEFILFLKDVAPMVITAATAVCVAWVKAKPGRKVRLKIGDVEAEGQSTDEIAKLLAQAKEFQSANPTKANDAD